MQFRKALICLFIISTLVIFSSINIIAENDKSINNELNIKQEEKIKKESDKKKVEQEEKEEDNTTVKIISYYDAPESINNEDIIVLEGVSKGEYIEIIVEGEILKFEHIKLEWNNGENGLMEKEIINKIDVLSNQTVILKTYMPEGIPSEKIKWKSKEGKIYQFIVQESGIGNREWQFSMN